MPEFDPAPPPQPSADSDIIARASGLIVPPRMDGPRSLRIVSYNIHKGVQGIGPLRRLEIHNMAAALAAMDADIVCLQEVRAHNLREAAFFPNWPTMGQAEFLAPLGYQAIYRTNARTPGGEHGNALLSRWPVLHVGHEDVSDHRWEQRGLLHVALSVRARSLHVIVAHFGLLGGSRMRQAARLAAFIAREVPPEAPLIVAGDFNEWGPRLSRFFAQHALHSAGSNATFPSIAPLAQLDHVYLRGLRAHAQRTPRGRAWWRMSDHLPLIVECEQPA